VVCLIGLFAIGAASQRIAIGPLVLMLIFLVFLVLYHLSLNAALDPLLKYLPKNLEAEEEALLAETSRPKDVDPDDGAAATTTAAITGASSTGNNGAVGNGIQTDGPVDFSEKDNVNSSEGKAPASMSTAVSSQKQPNFLIKFLRPDKYTDYATMRRLIPSDIDIPHYEPEVERDAYYHPAITDQLPLLWVPKDDAGVSRQEVTHSAKVIPISDQDAWLDEKNKIQWKQDELPPIYTNPVYF